MASIKPKEIVDHLSTEMRRALAIAVEEVMPEATFDPHELFRAFRRAVRRKCNTWEDVPDRFVKTS